MEQEILHSNIFTLKGKSNAYTFDRIALSDFVKRNYTTDSSLLVFVEEGAARVIINGVEHVVDSHDFLFMFPHSEIKLVEEIQPCRVCILGYFMALQESVTMHIGPSFFVAVMSKTRWTMDEDTLKAARAFCVLFEYNFKHGTEMFAADMAASLFSMFIQMFYQQIKDQLPTDNAAVSVLNRSLWWRFVELLGANFKEHHQVSYYADQLCVSSKYLAQIVKRIARMSPKALIDRRLAGESAYLLARTEMTIQEISIRLGFPDQSYFGRFFKRTFNMSPLAFRLRPDLRILDKLSK